MSDLSIRDSLRKDYKEWEAAGGRRLGISSVTRDIHGWYGCEGSNFRRGFREWMEERGLDVLLVLASFRHDGEWVRRIVTVTGVDNAELFGRMNSFLEREDHQLHLARMEFDVGAEESRSGDEELLLKVYAQGNLQATRKVYHPLLVHGLFADL